TGCTSRSTTRTATLACSEGVRSWIVTAMSSASLSRNRGRQAEAVELVGVLPEDLLPLFVGEIARDRVHLGHVPVRVARAEHDHVGLAGHLDPLGGDALAA